MKILYDARFITPQMTGVGQFADSLLSALGKLDNNIELHALYYDPLHNLPNVTYHRAPVEFDSHPVGDLYRNYQLLKLLDTGQFELYFSPAFYCIQRRSNVRQIVALHDLAVFDQPENFPKKFGFYLRNMIKSTCKNADSIITSSYFIADRIKDRFPKTKDKVIVIPYGVSDVYLDDCQNIKSQVKQELCVPDRFILSISTIEPRKNLLVLLDAYSIYRRRVDQPLPLLLVGKDGYKAEVVKKRACKSDLGFFVRFLDYIPDKAVAHLYRMAEFMVYPSVYEGFGFPVLEAMACGCPVLASNKASIPEVAGDAAMLVDPSDPVKIAEGMVDLTNDQGKRSDLSQMGRIRAEKFTWDKAAIEVASLFLDVSRM